MDFSLYGNDFLAQLRSRIVDSGSKTIGYSSNNSWLAQSDRAQNGSGIRPFYHAPDESYTGDWNKEHVWPNSRGAGKSGCGADPQMLRPTISSENSARGNNFFGLTSSKLFDPATFGYEGARGECARIIFYCAARYSGLTLSNDEYDSTSEKTMGRLDYLMQWNRQYPVNEREIYRNDFLDAAGFARNPFIDHPEYAEYIWTESGVRTSAYEGGEGGEGGGGTVTPTLYNTYELVTSLSDLSEDDDYLIVSSADGSSYFSLHNRAKSDTLPWYLVGNGVTINDGVIKSNNSTSWKLEIDGDTYRIKDESNTYLYNYIDGTHYSIGLTTTADESCDWQIKDFSESTGGFNFLGSKGVYFEYYKDSFCGYSKASSYPTYLYRYVGQTE